jgi:hypothetical protein
VKLRNNIHLAYCTNIHRGETWEQTFETLQKYALAVRDRVCPNEPYAIGLRLGDQASRQLSERSTLTAFQKWLDKNNCYIFTINGFPFGSFHGTRVKEQVYAPDWTSEERVAYTNRLFDLLAELVPSGVEGSVSTVPCSFKEFITTPEQVTTMRANLWKCVEHIARVSERSGRALHLGLEPEPLCYLETTAETVAFFQQLRANRPHDERLARHLGVNYDTCHLAIEFEDAATSIRQLQANGIKISKLHFSSALKVKPTKKAREALLSFVEPVYFHQVVAKWPENGAPVNWNKDGLPAMPPKSLAPKAAVEDLRISRTKDLDLALSQSANLDNLSEDQLPEWRIHFHIPLHSRPTELFATTSQQILGVIDLLAENPNLCHHIEMETYTWEVLPGPLKNRNVVDQLADEYAWTLDKLRARNLA